MLLSLILASLLSVASAQEAQTCLSNADCTRGVCEGFGCDDAHPGVCVDPERACTADMRPYCGCDGETFMSSGTCAGARYRYAAPCGEPESWEAWTCGTESAMAHLAERGRLHMSAVQCMETTILYTPDEALVGTAHRLLTQDAMAKLAMAEAREAGQVISPPYVLPMEWTRNNALQRVQGWADFAKANPGEHEGLAEACGKLELDCGLPEVAPEVPEALGTSGCGRR